MLEDQIKRHVAVSSLESPEHATRKDPKIISITWFIGKRCNYDCSYCPSYFHDNFSPHIDLENARKFIDELDFYASQKGKKWKMVITGGEPFVNPSFLAIIKHMKSKKNCIKLVVVTNGSMNLEIYHESISYIDNLTISLHLEKENTIQNTINKILELNKTRVFLNVNLMALPKKFDLVRDAIEVFQKNNVNFVLRKIEPPSQYENKISKGDEEAIRKEATNYDENKLKRKQDLVKNREHLFQTYYAQDELDFLNEFSNKKQWNNIKLHGDDYAVECNTDDLIRHNSNNWQGWQCFIGIDSLYVQHNGKIYRGNCMQGGQIGEIGKKIDWPVHPISCPIKSCLCNNDMVIRKAKENKYLDLIS